MTGPPVPARALLTGVTGFVGAHLARSLVDAGSEVHAIVRPEARLDRIPDLVGRIALHTDTGVAADLRAMVDAAAPEITFHLATRFVAEHDPDDVQGLVVDNVAFPARLADALATVGRRTLVNVGTAWQHVEGAAYRPRNLYAATKQAYEDVLRYYTAHDRLDAVTVNLFDSYGPQDHRPKLLSALLRALDTGTPLAMSSGRQLLDLVHVRDIVDALVRAGDQRRRGDAADGPYAVSSGRPCTLRGIVDDLSAVAGRPVPVRWGARPDRPGEMLEPWDAGPPVPGWVTRVPLRDGLAELVARAEE